MVLQLLTKSSRPWLPNYFPDSWFSAITHNHLFGIWSRLCYSLCFLFRTSYLVNPVLYTFRGGGGFEDRNTAKKVNEHPITARKVDETPSPSNTVRFEVTATPQIEILFTASKKHQHRNTANSHVPLVNLVMYIVNNFDEIANKLKLFGSWMRLFYVSGFLFVENLLIEINCRANKYIFSK